MSVNYFFRFSNYKGGATPTNGKQWLPFGFVDGKSSVADFVKVENATGFAVGLTKYLIF
jgi:hypothetical protein